jgi:hypothetical protein
MSKSITIEVTDKQYDLLFNRVLDMPTENKSLINEAFFVSSLIARLEKRLLTLDEKYFVSEFRDDEIGICYQAHYETPSFTVFHKKIPEENYLFELSASGEITMIRNGRSECDYRLNLPRCENLLRNFLALGDI